MREENERGIGGMVDAATKDSDDERMKIHGGEERGSAMPADEGGIDERGRGNGKTPGDEIVSPSHENGKNGRNRRRGSSSSGGTSSSSSSSSSDDDSSSSSDESDDRLNAAATPAFAPRPVFVPKSKRGTVAEVEMRQKKLDDAEERRHMEAEKRAIKSRALVAEIASSASKGGKANDGNEGDEFDTGESGGDFIPVPDDADPDDPDLVAAERDAWEVRELLRLLRDVDVAREREKERLELERRRALTDEERLAEDRSSGRYRAPGEARRRAGAMGGRTDGGEGHFLDGGGGHYLQRFHHRGAFYMDEDTLDRAGPNDVRHRAAEYSRAATGEDKIDKSALPEVMQVKKFGFAGYSTKYKGLAKEDTTDRKMDFLPILRGREGGAASRGRGGGYGNNNGVDGRGGDRRKYG
jgi:microfibrillar-associated protein 1